MQNILLHFPESLQMDSDQFFEFCMLNRNLPYTFELLENGKILISMTSLNTGNLNAGFTSLLFFWNMQNKLGKIYDSSTGFTMPNGTVLSPDASFIAWVNIKKYPKEEFKKFTKIVPDFVGEIRSITDDLADQLAKMQKWMAHGVLLAWLLDPIEDKIYIFRKNGNNSELNGFDHLLSGENVLQNFEINLQKMINDMEKQEND